MTTRRSFISLLGGATAWPFGAPAQQPADQFHRIGILHSGTEAAVARYLATFRDPAAPPHRSGSST